ncbi:MAG: mechanosensitive ion channel domain-containing protein [Thiobacillus sp.]
MISRTPAALTAHCDHSFKSDARAMPRIRAALVVLASLIWLLALLVSQGVVAAEAEQGPPEIEQTVSEPGLVKMDGRTVLEIFAGFKTLPVETRAANIGERLYRVAESGKDVKIEIRETPLSHDLVAGDRLVMKVLDADAKAIGAPRELVAQDYARSMQEALDRYRVEHTPVAMWIALAKTVATLLVAWGVLWLFGRLYRSLKAWIIVRARRGMAAVQRKTYRMVRMDHLRGPLLALLGGLRLVVWVMVIYATLDLSLSYFPQTRGLAVGMAELVGEPLAELGSGLVAAIPKLIVLAVVFWLVRLVLRASIAFFTRVADGRLHIEGFYADWANPTRRIINLLIIVAGVMIAYPYIPGSSTDAFKGISIFLGVLLSIGSSGVISNLMTGLTITYMRAFRVGDVIRIGDTMGTVIESSLLITRLKTPKGLEINLPNSLVMAGQVINYSASDNAFLSTSVTIGYDAPWRQVHAMLLEAAAKTPGVRRQPAPFVLQTALEDFYVRYDLNVVLADIARQGRILSELHQNIQDVFNEYGVQIMSPNFEAQPEQPVLVPKSNWHAAPAAAEQPSSP